MHARIFAGDSPWAVELDGAYIPRDALRRHDPARDRHPHLERGSATLAVEPLGIRGTTVHATTNHTRPQPARWRCG